MSEPNWNVYQERVIEKLPIFWATVEEWQPPPPPTKNEQAWMMLEAKVNQRFARAIEAFRAIE